VSTCLAGPGVIFLRAGALQACFVLLHPCLRILLAIYSQATACMRQLMCTAVSQLRSDQIVPLHHHAHFMYPACLFFLYMERVLPGSSLLGARPCDPTSVAIRVVSVSTSRRVLLCCFYFHVVVKSHRYSTANSTLFDTVQK
jgi:hypothetical protein